MMPPAPTAPPLRGLPLNASTIVSPLGMPPLPHPLTVTERCPPLFTPALTDTFGCGAGRGWGSDPNAGQPGRTGTTTTRACMPCRLRLAPATPEGRATMMVTVPSACRVTEYAAAGAVPSAITAAVAPAAAVAAAPVASHTGRRARRR